MTMIEDCAAIIMETVPPMMRRMREEMRSHRLAELSVPQFRALGYIDQHPNTFLSAIAEHLGMTLPSTSKLVDGLVCRELVMRIDANEDRRRLALTLSPQGKALLDTAREETLRWMAEALQRLSNEDLRQTIAVLERLHRLFEQKPVQTKAEEQNLEDHPYS